MAILDADKVGFLRSERALIQTAGRAARNSGGRVILYGDAISPGMAGLINQTRRRRAIQQAYNEKHHITPRTIVKEKRQTISEIIGSKPRKSKKMPDFNCTALSDGEAPLELNKLGLPAAELSALISELTRDMLAAAEALEFERAADLRDQIRALSKKQ